MRRRVTRFWSVALATAVVILAPAPVWAGPGSGGGGGSGGSVDDVLVAYVYYSTEGGTGGSGCSWLRVDGGIAVDGVGVVNWPRVKDGITYLLWRRPCGEEEAWYEFPQVDVNDLLPQLLDRLQTTVLPKPQPVFEMLDPVNNWAYVTVPVDFRAGGNAWRTVSVTASIGPIWATVTAVPSTLTFDSGDPAGAASVSCTGTGAVAAYVAESPGECSYTYSNASSTSPYDGYHFLTSMTIGWQLTWVSSSGAGGALAPFSTSSTAPLAVAEVKGLVTCTGSQPEQGGC